MTPQMTFERHEKKYMLNRRGAAALLEALGPHIAPDERPQYSICSLYFDTPDFQLAQRAGRHAAYKEKLRLRSYGVPTADDTVYFELKKKLDGVTYKRRMSMTLREADAYLRAGIRPAETGQVFDEIDWLVTQNRLKPKALISYERAAYHGTEDPSLRLTVDSNVRYSMDHTDLAKGGWGILLVPPDVALVEVKVAGAMPLYLTQALSAAQAYPTSFSKYSNACRNLTAKEVRLHA